MGEAHPVAAALVVPESDAVPVFEAGEQVLDMVAPGLQLGIPGRWIDHAPLGRGVNGAAFRGIGGAQGCRDIAPVECGVAGYRVGRGVSPE
jgi:hypothetical protein